MNAEDAEPTALQIGVVDLFSARYGKRKNGATGAPSDLLTADSPSSISYFAALELSVGSFLCDQVCTPMVWPRRATSFSVVGSAMAMRPTEKKVAFVHCSSSASRIGPV